MPFTRDQFPLGTRFKVGDSKDVFIVVTRPKNDDGSEWLWPNDIPTALASDPNLKYDMLFSLDQVTEIIADEPVEPEIDKLAILVQALKDIIVADIHQEGDDIDNHVYGEPHSSRAWVGPYGLIAQRALRNIK